MAPRHRNSPRSKEQRKSNHMKKVISGNEATKISSFRKRFPTLINKAKQLETLCGVSVRIICFGNDGRCHMFPNNGLQLKGFAESYQELTEKEKKDINLMGYLEEQKRKHDGKKLDEKFMELSEWLNGLPEVEALSYLEHKLTGFKEKLKGFSTSTGTPNDVGLLSFEEQSWISENNSGSSIGENNNNNNAVLNFGGESWSAQVFPETSNILDNNNYVVSDHNSATNSLQELGYVEGFNDAKENFGVYNYEGINLLNNLDHMSYDDYYTFC